MSRGSSWVNCRGVPFGTPLEHTYQLSQETWRSGRSGERGFSRGERGNSGYCYGYERVNNQRVRGREEKKLGCMSIEIHIKKTMFAFCVCLFVSVLVYYTLFDSEVVYI